MTSKKLLILYPIGWIITILIIIYVISPVDKYQLPSMIAEGLFASTIATAALNYGIKHKKK